MDVRQAANRDILYMLKSEFPPLMMQLLDILHLEKRATYLPDDVSQVVLKLIETRKKIFTSAAERFSSDYV